MLRKFGIGVAAIVLLGTVPVAAEMQTQPVSQHRNSEIYCKTVPAETGSRIANRKVCMPRLDWERRQQHDQDHLAKVQYDALLVTNHR